MSAIRKSQKRFKKTFAFCFSLVYISLFWRENAEEFEGNNEPVLIVKTLEKTAKGPSIDGALGKVLDNSSASSSFGAGQNRLTIILPKTEGKQRFLRLTPRR